MSSTPGDQEIETESDGGAPPPFSLKFASWIYRWRWGLTAFVLAVSFGVFAFGVRRVSQFSASVAGLADTSNGNGAVKPLIFNPSLDVWFGEKEEAVSTYYEIEDRFVAEDFVMVSFEEPDHKFGVFSRESLGAIQRLTERFLTVPGVRHVRSLTYNPWIRWGNIEEQGESEEGLIISDLVEGNPSALSDEQIIERMIAILGAKRTASRVGEAQVRAVIGKDADFADHIGEPLLLGTILNDNATTTAIQIQVLRPRVDDDKLAAAFPDSAGRADAPILHSIGRQRAALRGIEHVLRLEQGLAVATPGRARLAAWIESLPRGEKKNALRLDLEDPTKNFMRDAEGALVQKFFAIDDTPSGYKVRGDSPEALAASAGFQPEGLSPFRFHLGGLPLFDRNFEEVGMGDAKYVPLMFLVIAVVLFIVFRRPAGVLIPISVVFLCITAMVGVSFAVGNLLNNLTMMAPNMLTAVGIADAIHLLAAWVLLRSQYDDKKPLIIEVVRRNALPVFLTSITTAVGFTSLMVSALLPVQLLGAMVAIGTFFAWALSMTLIPALLSLVPHRKQAEVKPSRLEAIFSEERARGFVDYVVRNRVAVLGVTGLVLVVAIIGMLRMNINSDFRAMFPPDNKTIMDFTWIEDRMGGVGDLELVFSGLAAPDVNALSSEDEGALAALSLREHGAAEQPQTFQPLTAQEQSRLNELRVKEAAWNAARIGVSSAFLKRLDAFETRLRDEMAKPDSALNVVTDLMSPLDILRKMHQVQHQNRAAHYRVPAETDVAGPLRTASLTYDEWAEEWSLTPGQDASSLAAQYYLQYESGARPGEALTTQLSADRTQFRMQARVRQATSNDHLIAFERIREIARNDFPELAATMSVSQVGQDSSKALSGFTLSGKTLLNARTMELFSMGFIKSMILALTVITLLIGVMFRSVWFALLSLIPNVLPILIPLSVFGLLGLSLDGPAILVSSVALGVCVDDTIHFFTKYSRGRREGRLVKDALAHAIVESGAAMTVSTGVLMIGFATLLLSDFAPNFQMGVLAVVMIGLAWVADFFVTVAVLSFEREPSIQLAASPVVVMGQPVLEQA